MQLKASMRARKKRQWLICTQADCMPDAAATSRECRLSRLLAYLAVG